MIPLLVVLGAAVGAPLRYATDRLVQSRHGTAFPWGTFVVNTVGSFVLGALLGVTASPPVIALVGTGFCGGLTTYSTFAFETVQLGAARDDTGRRAGGGGLLAALNAMGSVLACLGAAGLGLAVGTAVGS